MATAPKKARINQHFRLALRPTGIGAAINTKDDVFKQTQQQANIKRSNENLIEQSEAGPSLIKDAALTHSLKQTTNQPQQKQYLTANHHHNQSKHKKHQHPSKHSHKHDSHQPDIKSMLLNVANKATGGSFDSLKNRKILGSLTNKQLLATQAQQPSLTQSSAVVKRPLVITLEDEDSHLVIEDDISAKLSTNLAKQHIEDDSNASFVSFSQKTFESDAIFEETVDSLNFSSKKNRIDFADPQAYYQPPEGIENYPDVIDFDRTQLQTSDFCAYGEPHYAWDIFLTDKLKETHYITTKYLTTTNSDIRVYEINTKMRAVLVDWMVQMQDGLALNHEVLYMAVKIVDQYLMRKPVPKQTLQLLGLVALLISCKFDERLPPEIDEFLDNTKQAYSKRQVIQFEMEVLKTLNFDITFPLSYRFLRRYARCTGCDMRTLTLARYILESSLLEHDLVDQIESKISAAALLLAFKMIDFEGGWSKSAEFYTTYTKEQLKPLMTKLNEVISLPADNRVTFVRNKYSRPSCYKVAKIPNEVH